MAVVLVFNKTDGSSDSLTQGFSSSAYWHCGQDTSLVLGAVLCLNIVGWLATTSPSPTTMTTQNVYRPCQMSPGGQNHPWLKTTAVTQGGYMVSLPFYQKPNKPIHSSQECQPRRSGPVTPVGGAWLFWFGGGNAAHRLLALHLLDAPTRREKCRAFNVQMAHAA